MTITKERHMSMCVCVYVYMCVCVFVLCNCEHGPIRASWSVEVRAQFCGVGSLLPQWDLGTELDSSDLCIKILELLSCESSLWPPFFFLEGSRETGAQRETESPAT